MTLFDHQRRNKIRSRHMHACVCTTVFQQSRIHSVLHTGGSSRGTLGIRVTALIKCTKKTLVKWTGYSEFQTEPVCGAQSLNILLVNLLVVLFFTFFVSLFSTHFIIKQSLNLIRWEHIQIYSFRFQPFDAHVTLECSQSHWHWSVQVKLTEY